VASAAVAADLPNQSALERAMNQAKNFASDGMNPKKRLVAAAEQIQLKSASGAPALHERDEVEYFKIKRARFVYFIS
jgi:hypothetical protein